ncbi:MAG: alpha-amylase family protein [Planctomycetota bacterium]
MTRNAPALPFRQIRLDFHTSSDIPDVGIDFDPDRFADRLVAARVNSINVFARCHHGHLYYPSKAHAERIHPNLRRPTLLNDQLAALRERGIRCPVYTTVQWDEYTANAHRDWVCVDPNGKLRGTAPLEPGFYRFLDVYHPGYRAFLRQHVVDLFDCLGPLDGVWFDIVKPIPSVAPHWIAGMDDAALDPESPEDRARFAVQVVDEWKLEITAFVRQLSNDCLVFYNAGHIGPGQRGGLDACTHMEIESLPSGGWGYTHFPSTASYVRTLGKPALGMTGKFHTHWGDFHSYKNAAALEYECFKMLAYGMSCCIGDQLHPRGELDEATYDLIGGVYESVEAKEPWCGDARPVTESAVFNAEEWAPASGDSKESAPNRGTVRMLEELGHQFDTIDTSASLDGYRLAVLPDAIAVDAVLSQKLTAFVEAGGAILSTGSSGLDHELFTRDLLGIKPVGPAPCSPDFVVPGELSDGLADTGYAMYQRGVEAVAMQGTSVLSQTQRNYFDRTWRRFCSHMHAPSTFEVGYPGVTQRGRAIWFCHPIFSQYDQNAPRWCKTLVANALARLLPVPLIAHNGPSTASLHLLEQPNHRRFILHVLHYVPVRKGAIDVIEDVLSLHDLTIRVRLLRPARSSTVIPSGEALRIINADGNAQQLSLPRVDGHAMIALPYD